MLFYSVSQPEHFIFKQTYPEDGNILQPKHNTVTCCSGGGGDNETFKPSALWYEGAAGTLRRSWSSRWPIGKGGQSSVSVVFLPHIVAVLFCPRCFPSHAAETKLAHPEVASLLHQPPREHLLSVNSWLAASS